MNFKLILGLVCTAISVLATDKSSDVRDKCDVFVKKVTDKGRNYVNVDSSFSCYANKDNGEIESITVRNCEEPIYDLAKYANVKKVNYLELREVLVDQKIIDFIGSLKKLNYLEIQESDFKSDLDWSSFKNLKELKTLKIWDNTDKKIKEFPESFYSLTKLEELVILNQDISYVSDSISNLKNLKELTIYIKKDENIPKGLCQLKNLRRYNGDDPKISLKELCKDKETSTDLPVSKNYKCGKKEGTRCPDGQCCSKYGWCGKSNDYCGTGCQTGFGKCK